LYSRVLWRIEESLQMLDAECFESDRKHLYNLINSLIDVDTQIDKSRFEHRMKSIEESKSLIEMLDRSLTMLKNYPDNGERLFEILQNSYSINKKEKVKEDELLSILNISRTTLYREKRRAIEMLGVILWGFVIPNFVKAIEFHDT
jgi:hypothetical protein